MHSESKKIVTLRDYSLLSENVAGVKRLSE